MKAGRILGHDVQMGPVTIGGPTGREVEVKLVRRWWAPLPLAWAAAGMVSPWWWRPYVFLYALVKL